MEHYFEPKDSGQRWQAFQEIVESRRSVRVFKDAPIPEAVMKQCLDLALLAPTSSNLQCWEFHWISSPSLKKKLVGHCFSQSAAKTAAELVVAVARLDTWRDHARLMQGKFDEIEAKGHVVPKGARTYYEKLVPFVYSQGFFGEIGFLRSLLMSFLGLFRVVPREPHGRSAMKTWAVKTTALACENLMLALRAAGYDSCPMEGFDSCRVKRLLGFSRNQIPVMIVGAGLRDASGVYGPRIRFDRARFIKEVT